MRPRSLLPLLMALLPTLAQAEMAFQTEIVEPREADRIGEYAWIELDAAGHPHISYMNRTAGELRYAVNTGSGWEVQILDGKGPDLKVGGYTFIAFDPTGEPHITYFDWTNFDLRHAWREDGQWNIEIVDSEGECGRYSSLRFDAAGTMHVVYYHEGREVLRYAVNDGSGWVLSDADADGRVGVKARMILDAQGRPHAAYYDADIQGLRYAWLDQGTWHVEIADPGVGENVGSYASIAIDDEGWPHITHWNATQGSVDYARKTPDGWFLSTVEDQDWPTGQWPQLLFDSAGRAVICWYDLGQGQLRFAHQYGGLWSIQTLDAVGNTGIGPAMVLDAHDRPHIAYYDSTLETLHYGVGESLVPTVPISFGAFRARFSSPPGP